MSKAPKPKRLPHWLNKKQMAASLGISVQAFDQWGVEPAARIGREAFYSVDDVLDNRLKRQQERLRSEYVPKDAAFDPVEADRERMLLTREQRIGQGLKNAQLRRELAPVSVIDWALSKVGGQIAAILESVPLKVKRLLPRLTATEIEHIKREVVKAQNAAARVTVDLDEYYDRDSSGDSPSDPPRAEGP